MRPLSKAPNPQLLPGRRSIGCPLLRVCVHCCVCVHLDGLNAEHKFRVWVTILGHTSLQNSNSIQKHFLIDVILKLFILILHFYDLINYQIFIKPMNPLQFQNLVGDTLM